MPEYVAVFPFVLWLGWWLAMDWATSVPDAPKGQE